MFKNFNKVALLALCMGLITVSCEKDTELEEINVSNEVLQTRMQKLNKVQDQKFTDHPVFIDASFSTETPVTHNLREVLLNEAVEPSECAPTEFVAVQNSYLIPLINDLYDLFGPAQYANIFYLYMDLNFYHAYLDNSKDQYFGANGDYTKLVEKRQRELEKFWNMPNEIFVKGQHTATLNDREKLADIYEIVGSNIDTREEAYAAADQILYFNQFSTHLPDNPFFAVDGFATSLDFIVIGDGIVQMLAETGIQEDIVWTGILAHEWAHQVQFNNYAEWYPNGAAEDPAEDTRYTELEADFFAAYYMTHKRGATYNWKRVEQFFEVFVQIGDCNFDSSGHHGTPLQRERAAQLGYDLANDAHKQGHIMTEQELHEYFVANVDSLL